MPSSSFIRTNLEIDLDTLRRFRVLLGGRIKVQMRHDCEQDPGNSTAKCEAVEISAPDHGLLHVAERLFSAALVLLGVSHAEPELVRTGRQG